MARILYSVLLSTVGAIACSSQAGGDGAARPDETGMVSETLGAPAPSAASGPAAVVPATAFSLDTGKALPELVFPALASPQLFQSPFEAGLQPSDATVILRFSALLGVAWFDAIAPYHPTAVGVYSRLGRRPASESVTYRQRNIAILYATLRVASSIDPGSTAVWRGMLQSAGLNPDDNSLDPKTPVGIGNLAGMAIVGAREHDGMNQLGDEGGRRYNLQLFADYTGFFTPNTAYHVVDYGRWQPLLLTSGNGIFRVQQFVTPQLAFTEPFMPERELSRLHAPPPRASNPENAQAYRRQADEVLAEQAGLDDVRKMTSELFNNKFVSLTLSHEFRLQTLGLSYDEEVHYRFLLSQALFDASIVAWREKYRYAAVRPFTAIRHLYGDSKITAWGGPGRGTVSDITGDEWRSYLPTPDHPEYPSGSTCFCAVQAEASRKLFGSDRLGWSFQSAKGSSVIEPGVTPAQDLTLTFDTWTDFEKRCGQSRVWGGVHFPAAVREAEELCRPIGDMSVKYLNSLVDGTAPPRSQWQSRLGPLDLDAPSRGGDFRE